MKFLYKTSKDSNFLSLTSLLIGILILSYQDALIKFIANDTTFWQLQFIRSFFNIMFLYIIVILSQNKSLLIPENWLPVTIRGTMMVLCMFCFFSASPILSLSQMAAGLYTFPIFVTILSIVITKEMVGKYRLMALVMGFIGSIFILQLWKEDFNLYQLLPILAGFFYACNIIMIRKYCRNESPVALTFVVGILFFISGIIGIIFFEFIFEYDQNFTIDFITDGWVDLTLIIFLFIVACSLLNIIGNLALAKAYQNAESSWLAPLDYFYLVFACLWSKLVFDVWPENIEFAGIFLIVTSGLIITYREKVNNKNLQ